MTRALCVLHVSLLFLVSLTMSAFALDVVALKTKAGIEVWHVEDKSIPLIALEYTFDTGATTDPAGKEGTAHLLSALMDEGAGIFDGTTFRAMRDDRAIKLSFGASADNMHGSLRTPLDNKDMAIELARSAFTSPLLAPEAIERNRKAAIVAVKSRMQDPSNAAYLAAGQTVLKDHPYAKPTDGTELSLAALTRDDLIAAHKRLYARSGLKVVIVGAIGKEAAMEMVDTIFGTLPAGLARDPLPAVPDWQGNSVKIVDWSMPQSIIMFGGPGIAIGDPEYMTAQLVMDVLSNERLNKEVREKRGLTYGIDYSLFNFREAGFTLGYFSTANEQAAEAIKVVRAELKAFAEHGPTAEELEAVKNLAKGTYPFRFESISSTATSLMAMMSLGLPPDYSSKRNAAVDTIVLDQAKAMAKRLIDPEKFFVVAVGKPVGVEAQ